MVGTAKLSSKQPQWKKNVILFTCSQISPQTNCRCVSVLIMSLLHNYTGLGHDTLTEMIELTLYSESVLLDFRAHVTAISTLQSSVLRTIMELYVQLRALEDHISQFLRLSSAYRIHSVPFISPQHLPQSDQTALNSIHTAASCIPALMTYSMFANALFTAEFCTKFIFNLVSQYCICIGIEN